MLASNNSNNSNKTADGSDLPKIQLESKEDVQFLQQQLGDFLRKTVAGNTTLRDSQLSEEQRAEAETLIMSRLEEWTGSMWTMAGSNMAVNGFAYEEAMQEKSRIEPLDEALRGEVRALREEADELLLAVTQKRKTVPDQIENLVRDGVARESLVAEKTTAIKGLSRADTDPNTSSTGSGGGGSLPYVDEAVNSEFERAARLAKRIEKAAPASIDKMKQLLATLEDVAAGAGSAETADDGNNVRSALIGDGATDTADASVSASAGNGRFWKPAAGSLAAPAEGDDDQQQLLSYKAALHAVTQSGSSATSGGK
ncbi:hypothetical protein GGI11_004082 [Coemansia sp. RSA 2049]|nr:hypothetical protein GGI11_004082 [Coemansia sp. RSA 2049]KAJ2522896.1 hypothetical protein H4217_000435 [Coemansia sp. RSA 1939]KAJ2618195.1 hypothetical protein EV177_000152 [Coemansia sp. RSA 1804]KAJ2695322.1 hypothetical protein GGH99_000180 [Coemansia sp. RSA 1285]